MDGGLDVGVMYYVGKAVKEMAVTDVPTIGIATYRMVTSNNLLEYPLSTPIDYGAYKAEGAHPKQCPLNANHSHFILMDSAVEDWRQEIK